MGCGGLLWPCNPKKMRKEDKMSTAVGVEGEDRGLARVAIATQRRPGLRSSWPDDSRSHARRSREVGGYMCLCIYIYSWMP